MARYLGPKLKLSRREGTDLFSKEWRETDRLKVQDRQRARPTWCEKRTALGLCRPIERKTKSEKVLWSA